jgi:hypothetical protein
MLKTASVVYSPTDKSRYTRHERNPCMLSELCLLRAYS